MKNITIEKVKNNQNVLDIIPNLFITITDVVTILIITAQMKVALAINKL